MVVVVQGSHSPAVVVEVLNVVCLCLCFGSHEALSGPQDAVVVVVDVEGSQLAQLSATAAPAKAAATNAVVFILLFCYGFKSRN